MSWGFDGAHGTDVRPAHKASVHLWAKDPSTPEAKDGTRITSSFMNRVAGNLRRMAVRFGSGLTESGDDDLADGIVAAIGATAPAAHTHDDRYYTEAEIDDALAAVDAGLALKAPIASPAFTGTPTVPTAAQGTNTTQAASTAFVHGAINDLINAAPGLLDTLDEIAAALGDDPNFAATMTTALAAKAPLASPTLTGTPAAPTATPGTNTTQLATTAFVQAALGAIGSGVASFNTRTGAVTPANDDYAVGNLQAVAATTLLGNSGGASARPAALAMSTVKGMLGLAVGDVSGAAPLASPTFTGTPAAPTAAQGTNTTQLASTAFVCAEIAAAGGAGRTEISRTTVSSPQATVEFSGTWTSYKALLLVAVNVSGSASASLNASVSDDNGSTYKTVSGVEAHTLSVTYVTSVDFNGYLAPTTTRTVLETAALSSANVPCLGAQAAAAVNGNFSLFIEDVATSSLAKHIVARGSSQTSARMQFSIGQTASMGAVNRIKLAASTGNIDGGTYILYGIK